ncbi:hypothetical protein GQ53DRAFT_642883, partial [Thozetella sp. PMI_491]
MSIEPESSTKDSLDTGVLSISSDSKDLDRKDQNQAGFKVFIRAFRRLITEYHQEAEGFREARGDSKGKAKEVGQSSPSLISNSLDGGKGVKRKRICHGDSQNDGDEDESDDLPSRDAKQQKPDALGRPKHLACPFWKLDPDKHWECFLKKISTISYVKQHLSRRHTPSYYCPRCYAIFPDEPTYDQHFLDVPCVRGATATLDGISHPQSRLLSRKSKGSVEEQWFAMWHILFPGQPRPASIYVDS